jgi:predicted metal-dependent hydrolase
MSKELLIGDLTFAVRLSSRRKTVGITVDRGGELVVDAPRGAPGAAVERIVRAKLPWVYEKLAKKQLLQRPGLPVRFVSGEGHFYLGRQYRILPVERNDDVPLRLFAGRFELDRAARPVATQVFRDWYAKRAREWLPARVATFATQLGIQPKRVEVRDLGFRWGSCSRGILYFHWRVMQLSPRLVEYVVAHEATHLLERQHGPSFWRLLGRLLVDCQERKRALATVNFDDTSLR